MESFYGGRQGASFVLVERFDGIDIEENKVLKNGFFATKSDEVTFEKDSNGNAIERNPETEKNYEYWKKHVKNGETVNGVKFPLEYAKGMKQCFMQGGATTNIVNYGEYVIIDTIAGLQERANPDNGKVFRRNMAFNDTMYGGADYIGQMVGPEGESPEIVLDDYDNINALSEKKAGELVVGDDLIAGNQLDRIKYIYTNIQDEYTGINTCKVGFKVPYLVQNFAVRQVGAYDGLSIEHPTDRPFFDEWLIKIPKGIKGDTFKNFKVITASSGDGVESYDGQADDRAAGRKILVYDYYNYDNATPIKKTIYIGDYNVVTGMSMNNLGYITSVYSHNDNQVINQTTPLTWVTKVELIKENNEDFIKFIYNNNSENKLPVKWINNAIYNEENGDLYFGYNNERLSEIFKIKQIQYARVDVDSKDEFGNKVEGDQKLYVKYNTDAQEIPISDPINYIKEINLTKGGINSNLDPFHLVVYNSDPEIRYNQDNIRNYFTNKDGNYVNGWQDLGNVRGPAGTLHIIADLTPDEADTILIPGNSPEETVVGKVTNPDDYVGWGYTVTRQNNQGNDITDFYIYAYEQLEFGTYGTRGVWVNIGSINGIGIDAARFVITAAAAGSQPDVQTDILNNNGIWLIENEIEVIE